MRQSPREIAQAVTTREELLNRPEAENLRIDEYRQFTSEEPIQFPEHKEFEIRKERVPESLRNHIDRIVRVVRLREVRAISGFTRINPPGGLDDEDENLVAHISESRLNWLPAIEVRGEGIFIRFNEARLKVWAGNPIVLDRAGRLNTAYATEWHERYGDERQPPREIRPELVLVHTFAHVLMRQISLDCGYSSASLRERLYVGDAMRGLLIYTGTTDADGTMGGLARQGEAARLEVSVCFSHCSVALVFVRSALHWRAELLLTGTEQCRVPCMRPGTGNIV